MKKGLILASLALALLVPREVKAEVETHNVWATGYCLTGTTATGTQTKNNHTVASKPEWFGYTMLVWVDDGDGIIKPQNFIGTYVVEDTGGENIKKGYVIDIYNSDYEWCKQFGGQRVIIQVIKSDG